MEKVWLRKIMICTLPFQKTVNWIQRRITQIDKHRDIQDNFFYKKVLKQLITTTLYEPWVIQYVSKVFHPNSSNISSMQSNKIVDMWP